MSRSGGREPSLDALGRLVAILKFRHDFFKTNKFGELRLRPEQNHPIVKRVWMAFYQGGLDKPIGSELREGTLEFEWDGDAIKIRNPS